MLCIGCLLAGLAADRFGASRTFIVGSLLLAVASWAFTILPAPARSGCFCSTVRWGCASAWWGGALCDGAGLPGGSTLHRHLFSYNLSYAIFGGLTPIAVTMLMGCRRWRRRYVLALSLMGLGLGIWLRQERRR